MCVYVRAEDEAKKLKIRKENLFREILEKEKMSQWHGVEWGGHTCCIVSHCRRQSFGATSPWRSSKFQPVYTSLLIWLTLGEQWLMVEIRIEI